MWYSYTMEYYLYLKNDEILSFASKTDGIGGHYVK
jgi:hypothetical protein